MSYGTFCCVQPCELRLLSSVGAPAPRGALRLPPATLRDIAYATRVLSAAAASGAGAAALPLVPRALAEAAADFLAQVTH